MAASVARSPRIIPTIGRPLDPLPSPSPCEGEGSGPIWRRLPLHQETRRAARSPARSRWERAARGPNGRSYPWGNEPPDASRARFAFRFLEYYRVGSYPAGATPDGILDMAGNVWQWTSSLYRAYPYHADDRREDPKASGERIARAGAQSSSAEMLRSTFRNAVPPARVAATTTPITFRCARDAE